MLARLKSKLRKAISLVLVFLPSCMKVAGYRFFLGYEIGKDVKIGRSWIYVQRLEIEEHVRIGHRNTVLNVPYVRIGAYSTIGDDNTFVSTDEFTSPEGISLRGNRPELIIGQHCGISFQNYFDVQDEFTIGAFTTIAGIASVFFTHFLDVERAAQSTRPIHIGKYCMIGSSVRFVPGATIPDNCVVGMGAVVTKKFDETHAIIGGNPAGIIRFLPRDAKYFTRPFGFISSIIKPPFGS
jgi:acetyltransferase-like isoleucine patch superfamily enzyme